MLNLAWVRTFLALERSQSFHAAAAELGIAQPTVSQQLQKLESCLGACLLHRRRRGCEPTAAGLAFLPYARSLLRVIERARADLAGGGLRIGASSNIGIYLLQPRLRSFLRGRDPDSVDVVIDRNPAIEGMLLNGEIDVAVMEWWQPRAGFAAARWRSEPLVVITPPGHPLAERANLSREELAGHAFLGGEPGTGTGRLLANYFADIGFPRPTRQLGSTEAVKQAVKAGLGISIVFASAVVDELSKGSLRAVHLADGPLAKDLFVAWPERRDRCESFARHLLGEALAAGLNLPHRG